MAKRTMRKKAHKSSDLTLEFLIDFVEKDRFTVLTAVLYIMAIGVIRSVSESYAGVYPGFGIHLLTQHMMFYFAVFFTGAVTISILGDIDIKKVINVQLFGFWINILPPFFDLLIYGRGFALGNGYNFLSVSRVLTPMYWIDPFYALENTSIGLKTMLILISLMSAGYVAIKWYLGTDGEKAWIRGANMLPRAIATFYGLWFVIACIGGLMLFINIDFHSSDLLIMGFMRQPILQKYYTGIGPNGDAFFMANNAPFLIIQQRSLMMILEYVTFLLLSLAPTMYLWRKNSIKILILSLDPHFLVYSAMAYLLGIVIANTVYPLYILHWPYGVFGYLLFVCTWEAVRLSEKAQKKPSTKKRKRKKKSDTVRSGYLSGILSESEYGYVPYVLLIFAVIFAVNLGPLSLLMIFVLLIIGFFYLKFEMGDTGKAYIVSSLGLLAFINGIITPSMWYIKEWNTQYTNQNQFIASIKTVVYYRNISITPEIVLLGIALMFMGLGLSLLIENLFTMYGHKSIHKNWAAILFLSSGMLLPLIILASDIMMVVCISSLFIINYVLITSNKDEEMGNNIEDAKTDDMADTGKKVGINSYTPVIIILFELLLLAIKYSGML